MDGGVSGSATMMTWNGVWRWFLEEGVPRRQNPPHSSEKRVCTIPFGPLQRSAPTMEDGRCPILVSHGAGRLSSVLKERKKKGGG